MRKQKEKSAPPHPVTTATTAPTPQKNTRAQQSRINGARSRGPNSHHGKLLSSRNALKHGLTATIHTVLNHESEALCNEVEDAWVNDLRPATKAEFRLVQQLANVNWRLERLAMMETSLLNIEMSVHGDEARKLFEFIDEVGILGSAWKASADSSNGLDLLRRYLATLQSQFNNTLKNFRGLETARKHPSNIRDSAFAEPYQRPAFVHAGTAGSPVNEDQREENHAPAAIIPRKPNEPEIHFEHSENTAQTPSSGSHPSPAKNNNGGGTRGPS